MTTQVWPSRYTAGYPCRTTPGNPTLHVWVPRAWAAGWFRCAGCGVIGICAGCHAPNGERLPAGAIAVWCETHRASVCGKLLPLRGAASLAV